MESESFRPDPRLEKLYSALVAARLEFEAAREAAREGRKMVADVGPTTRDGELLRDRVLKRYEQALSAYARILNEYTEAVLGKSNCGPERKEG